MVPPLLTDAAEEEGGPTLESAVLLLTGDGMPVEDSPVEESMGGLPVEEGTAGSRTRTTNEYNIDTWEARDRDKRSGMSTRVEEHARNPYPSLLHGGSCARVCMLRRTRSCFCLLTILRQ